MDVFFILLQFFGCKFHAQWLSQHLIAQRQSLLVLRFMLAEYFYVLVHAMQVNNILILSSAIKCTELFYLRLKINIP